jgi:hypothetical protein
MAILHPDNYRVRVDSADQPLIAKIVYNHDLKKFDIEAVGGLEGARFVTKVDLDHDA